jgi:hypothetical protein
MAPVEPSLFHANHVAIMLHGINRNTSKSLKTLDSPCNTLQQEKEEVKNQKPIINQLAAVPAHLSNYVYRSEP